MFSGIIEQTATVVAVRSERQNKHFTLRADFCRCVWASLVWYTVMKNPVSCMV